MRKSKIGPLDKIHIFMHCENGYKDDYIAFGKDFGKAEGIAKRYRGIIRWRLVDIKNVSGYWGLDGERNTPFTWGVPIKDEYPGVML